MTTHQLLLERSHHCLPIPMHGRSAKALPQRAKSGDCSKTLPPEFKGYVPQKGLN